VEIAAAGVGAPFWQELKALGEACNQGLCEEASQFPKRCADLNMEISLSMSAHFDGTN